MSWIHIDAEHGMTIARVMLDSGHRSVTLLDHLRSLTGVPGLGAAHGEVDAVVSSTAAAVDRATTSYLEEGVDMMRRLLALLQEQAAGSVVGQVMSPATILGASIVGGSTAIAAKSWAQDARTHADPYGNTYQVVANPRAGEVLGAGTLHYSAEGQPYYVGVDPMAPTGTATVVSGGTSTAPGLVPSRMSGNDVVTYFPGLVANFAGPPMWQAKTMANAIDIAYSSPY